MAGRDGAESGGENGHQTPASQDDGEARKDGDGDSAMLDRQGSEGGHDGTPAGTEHRRSDHERQGGSGENTMTSSSAAAQLYRLPITRKYPQQLAYT